MLSYQAESPMCLGRWSTWRCCYPSPFKYLSNGGRGPLLLLFVWWFSRSADRAGQLSGAFLLGYGVLRFCTEFFRLPDAHLGFMALGWVTQGQILCVPMVLLGVFDSAKTSALDRVLDQQSMTTSR